jgi:hypothetical protein
MNFLLHHHLATMELRSRTAGIGAMLPDLWRMANRRVRARALASTTRAEDVAGELERGVAHHLAVDHWFHQCAVFRQGEPETARAMRAACPAAPKLALFGHVSWELCLDGALLRAVGLDAVLAELRRALAEIDPRAAAELALSHGARRLDHADRRRFDERLRTLLERVAEGPWISGYRDGTGIAVRLEGLRRHFHLPRFTRSERACLGTALEQRLAAADTLLPELLAERHKAVAVKAVLCHAGPRCAPLSSSPSR